MNNLSVDLGAVQYVYYVDDLENDKSYTVNIAEDVNIGYELITISDDEGESIASTSEIGEMLLEAVREHEKRN